MKKSILILAMILITASASAQFYVSASGGYSFKIGEKNLGSSISPTGIEELKGSYGEGVSTQLRGGYFFNNKIGLELGVGYLYGFNQDVRNISGVPTLPEVNIKARGRAFGASLSAIYNVTDNFYARAGYLTKIGGRTEAVGHVASQPLGLDLNFTTDFHGKFPSGFIGAIGYKFPIADKWSLFAEVEYMGINVTRDQSQLADFSATLGGNPVTRDQLLGALSTLPAENQAQFAELLPLIQDEVQWGENGLPSTEAPYSSFGINFGITYTFGK